MAATSKKAKTVTVKDALGWLERTGTKANRDGLARYAIPSDKAFGVSVGQLRTYAKKTAGRSHALAAALWASGFYEARMLAVFVDDPALVTPAQMNEWCADFDNWAICDTACFHLFDKTPHAYSKVKEWSKRKPEFERRAAFALIASLAGHDKKAKDEPFVACLPLIEAAATDDRNFVKKAVSWALRGVGHRSRALHEASVALAEKLSESSDRTARWVGKDALRDLNRPQVLKKVASR